MSKSINDLVFDINNLLRKDKRMSESGLGTLNDRLTSILSQRLGEKEKVSSELRMSNLGTPCERKLWYQVNRPSAAESLLPHTRLKFLYGDIIEVLILSLAEEAGHKVEGQQDELELYGIKGHRDAVIDGVTVDVKSANSRQFYKFSKPLEYLKQDQFFKIYIDQLQLYMEAGKTDPLVTSPRIGAFLAVDKELGHIQLKLISKENRDWKTFIMNKLEKVHSNQIPDRAYSDEPDGMSGNRKLGLFCSYCPFKKECWPSLRTFIAPSGPKHLTTVKREPNMLESR